MIRRDRPPEDAPRVLEHHDQEPQYPLPDLSVVVPAYNEEDRLSSTVRSILEFLAGQDLGWEVIVVDDGSEDGTAQLASSLSVQFPNVRVESQPHLGKAAAVKRGVMSAKGANILFTDADLSTPIDAVTDLLQSRRSGADVVIGSREGASAHRIGEPFYRHFMGRAFNWVVRAVAVRGVKDTQCGFKLLSRESAEVLIPKLRVSQPDRPISGPRVSAFDVELLFLANRDGFRIEEIPVVWTHATGSKVRPGIDSVRMFVDVLTIRWNALRGKYN